jgi:hypothetical protein
MEKAPEKCSGCGADVLWVKSKNDRWMPLELEVKSRAVNGEHLVLFRVENGKAVHTDGMGHESHFAHCPYARRFRKKK